MPALASGINVGLLHSCDVSLELKPFQVGNDVLWRTPCASFTYDVALLIGLEVLVLYMTVETTTVRMRVSTHAATTEAAAAEAAAAAAAAEAEAAAATQQYKGRTGQIRFIAVMTCDSGISSAASTPVSIRARNSLTSCRACGRPSILVRSSSSFSCSNTMSRRKVSESFSHTFPHPLQS